MPHTLGIVGALSTLWVVVSNFVVHPFVAVSDVKPVFIPEPREVAEMIEAPLTALRDPSALHWDQQVRRGGARLLPALRGRRPRRVGRHGDDSGRVRLSVRRHAHGPPERGRRARRGESGLI